MCISSKLKEVPDINRWAAKILLDQITYLESIGNRLILDDISKVFEVYRNIEYRDMMIGIPDRHPFINVSDKTLKELIDSTSKAPGKRMLLYDGQLIDLLSKTKSTYGILEVPQENDVKYFYMRNAR